jgi:hypothetical protein
MLFGVLPNTGKLGMKFQSRKTDVVQRRVAIALERKMPGYDGKRRFSLRLYLPLGRPRVYRLKGYTTLRKVNRKLRAGRAQRSLWKVLLVALVVMAAAYFLLRLNPFQDMTEIFRMIGIAP